MATRTSDSMGSLSIAGVDDISQVNTATAESKYWNIDIESKISLGETIISTLYLGNNEIISIYLGSEKIL